MSWKTGEYFFFLNKGKGIGVHLLFRNEYSYNAQSRIWRQISNHIRLINWVFLVTVNFSLSLTYLQRHKYFLDGKEKAMLSTTRLHYLL